jgi:hypothetical protein
MLFGFSLLLLFPLIMHWFANRAQVRRVWTATGVAFGLIVAPASMGLYAFYFLSPYGLVPGMLGLLSLFVHEPPGFAAITAMGFRSPGEIVSPEQSIAMECFNGLFWGTVYGTVGYGLDLWRGSRRRSR